MTSATLFREGFDLDEVIAQLEDEHPGRVRVVDVNYGRDGGVMGFFARRTVGVRYCIEEEDGPMPAHSAHPGSYGQDMSDPLEDLLRAADAAELGGAGRPAHQPAGIAPAEPPTAGNVEFARMLLEMAAEKAAQRAAREAQEAGLPVVAQPATAADAPFVPASFVPASPTVGPAVRPGVAPAAAVADTVPAAAPALDLTALLREARTRPVGAHRAHAAAHSAYAAVAADPAALRPAPEIPSAVAPAPAAAPTPAPAPAPAAAVAPAASEPGPACEPHGAYPLRRRLVEIGVPVAWIRDHEADRYRATDQLVDRLPAAPEPQLVPGGLLVVAGPAAEAMQAGQRLCAAHRLDPATTVYAAGCGERVATAYRFTQPWEAERLAARLRHERLAPAIVVVATDDGASEDIDDPWAARLVAALQPDAVWLAVDAARKPADVRADARAFGRVDALAVFGAARTTSPASIWELSVPVALLDGRRATRGAWTALVLDKLTDLGG